nr:ketoacyl-ACP synthase III [Gammaproteobacteria bacterium]
MIYTRIASTGSYLPARRVSNDELAQSVDTSHAWILERTGIEQRHIANDQETTVFMGTEAAKQALETAGVSASDIDMIIVASCTAEKIFPSTACLIQEALGVASIPAFDIQAACSGFIYALNVSDHFIRSGQAKRVLLIGVEVMTRLVDWTDRRTCVLFGDGAGAVLLEASEAPGILKIQFGAEGRHKEVLYMDKAPGSFIQMQGNVLYKVAVQVLDKAIRQLLDDTNTELSSIDWMIPHQANARMIQATAEKLGLPFERVMITLNQHANTSAASIPLAFDWGIRQQKIKRGQHLLF